MNILLVERHWAGHHPDYFNFFVRYFLENGHKVSAFCPDPEAVDKFVLRELPDKISNFSVGHYSHEWSLKYERNGLTRQVGRLLQFNKIWRLARNKATFKPDLVFLPWMDDYTKPWFRFTSFLVDILLPIRWSGLLMQYQRHNYNKVSKILGSPASILAARNCVGILSLEEVTVEELRKKLPNKFVEWAPDMYLPVKHQQRDLIEKIKEKKQGRKMILLTGSLDPRKGVLEFVRLSKILPEKEYLFVLAGRLFINSFVPEEKQEIAQHIASEPENFIVEDRFMEDDEFDQLVSLTDVMYAVYRDFPYSSGILAKTAYHKVPVIVAEKYLMAQRTEKYSLGVVSSGRVSDLASQVKDAIELSKTDKFKEGTTEYAALTTPENFRAVLDKMVLHIKQNYLKSN